MFDIWTTARAFVAVPDVCASVDCRHDAVCVEEGGQGVCKCPVGFEGQICISGKKDSLYLPFCSRECEGKMDC